MFKSAEYIKSAFTKQQLITDGLPEIVLCGRSNVGKSSFINSLLNKKNLAKVSSTPGKTRSINYYLVNGKFYLVDLPGFGFAKAGHAEREEWAKLINLYLEQSEQIISVFHLVDSRTGPTALDLHFTEYISGLKLPHTVILTKADKLKKNELAAAVRNVGQAIHGLAPGESLFAYSSVNGAGKQEVNGKIARLLLFHQA